MRHAKRQLLTDVDPPEFDIRKSTYYFFVCYSCDWPQVYFRLLMKVMSQPKSSFSQHSRRVCIGE